MSKEDTTAISKDGLRYKSKQGGSLFGESTSMGTMSCYKCGLHKPRALGSFKKLLGKSMFVCGECKPTQVALVNHIEAHTCDMATSKIDFDNSSPTTKFPK
jgi:hypothetical protein